jgi:type III pantothenate kinase
MVDGMVERITKEMGTTPKIIATGGLAPLIAESSQTIEKIEQSLTLDGLKIINNFIKNN